VPNHIGDTLLIVRRSLALICCLLFSSVLFAAQLTGKVTNATTGKPADDDEVTLLSLNDGMQETSSARSDDQGRFSLNEPDESVEHLLRVSHGGTFYYKSVPVGTKTTEVNVYDSAAKVDGILEDGLVFQIQTGNGQLEVSEKFLLRNESAPPRTRMGDHSFEIELPPGAHLVDSMAAGPGGLPVRVFPVPIKNKKNHYGMPYPLRPGKTEIRVNYKVPYSGSFDFSVNSETSLGELGIIMPKSMKLNATGFAQDNDEAGMSVYFMKGIAAAQAVKFSVSGEGVAPREAQEPNPAEGGAQSPAPAGATGESSGARWYIIGLLFGLLVGGAFVVYRKMKRGPARETSSDRRAARRAQRESAQAEGNASASNGSVMDALKEELFQLETDRLEGRISQHDYESSKAGLDTLMRRQMKR